MPSYYAFYELAVMVVCATIALIFAVREFVKKSGFDKMLAGIALWFMCIGFLMYEMSFNLPAHLSDTTERTFEKVIAKTRDLRRFTTSEDGVKHMAHQLLEAKESVLHVALSQPIFRKHGGTELFENAVDSIAKQKRVAYRYIANPVDSQRVARIQRLLGNKNLGNYQAKYLKPDTMAMHMMNFMVFDDDEVDLAIPEQMGNNPIVVIRDPAIVKAFREFFLMQWAVAKDCRLGDKNWEGRWMKK
jgi:hypothetical protein